MPRAVSTYFSPAPTPTHNHKHPGNLVIDNSELIEKITLPITVGNWYYLRIRVIGDVVESIKEPRKND